MATYFASFLICAGVITLLIVWSDKSRKSLPLIFAATMMIMGGLAILQFLGTEAPAYQLSGGFRPIADDRVSSAGGALLHAAINRFETYLCP